MWLKICNKTQTPVYGIKNYRLLHSTILEMLQIACNQRCITSLVSVLIIIQFFIKGRLCQEIKSLNQVVSHDTAVKKSIDEW